MFYISTDVPFYVLMYIKFYAQRLRTLWSGALWIKTKYQVSWIMADYKQSWNVERDPRQLRANCDPLSPRSNSVCDLDRCEGRFCTHLTNRSGGG